MNEDTAVRRHEYLCSSTMWHTAHIAHTPFQVQLHIVEELSACDCELTLRDSCGFCAHTAAMCLQYSCRDSSVAYVPQSPARGWCRLLGARGLRPYELRHQCSVHHGRTAYSEFSLLDLYTRDVLGTVSTVV